MSTILFLNGNIYTMDAAQPRAQALAIDTMSGRILAVGDNDEVRRAGDRHAELVDLRGKTLLPGFIDAHIHLTYAAYRSYNMNAESAQVRMKSQSLCATGRLKRRSVNGYRVVSGTRISGQVSNFPLNLHSMLLRPNIPWLCQAKMVTCYG